MIDEQSPASGHDYASDRSAIGAARHLRRIIDAIEFQMHYPWEGHSVFIKQCPLLFICGNNTVYVKIFIQLVTCKLKSRFYSDSYINIYNYRTSSVWNCLWRLVRRGIASREFQLYYHLEGHRFLTLATWNSLEGRINISPMRGSQL